MTATTLIGFRNLHAATKLDESMTAVAMALTPHRLSRKGDIATLPDGRRFAWSESAERWLRYE